MAIKTAMSGAVELSGKYKNGDTVIFVVEAMVKAEPHEVATATQGTETKMSLKLVDAMPVPKKAANEYQGQMAAERDKRNKVADQPDPMFD